LQGEQKTITHRQTRTHDGQSNPVCNSEEYLHGVATIFYLFIIFFEDGQKFFLLTNVNK